jgi:hypothetical protein
MAGKGGKRREAGRKAKLPDKATIARQQAVAASGETPLEYMLRVMRDPSSDDQRRDQMARAAAPYVHSKLTAIEHTGKDGGPIETADVSDTELARAIAFTLAKAVRPPAH